jgi:hypothetical protein
MDWWSFDYFVGRWLLADRIFRSSGDRPHKVRVKMRSIEEIRSQAVILGFLIEKAIAF